MKTKPTNSRLYLCAVLMLTATAVSAIADDSSVIRLALQNTGVDTDAAGTVLSVLKSKSSVVSVKASRLTPGQSYTVTVGETPEATVVADKKGRVTTTFSTKPKKNKPLLDFDPRGQLIAIRDGTNSVLEAMVSGPGEPAGIVVDERARLTRLAGSGEATTRYQVLRDGHRFFTVKVERVEPGEWSLFVNGIFRGTIQVSGRQTTVLFDSNPASASRRLLDFDPRSQVVDIALGTNLVFTGNLEARANNVNVATPSIALAYIPSTGVDANGTARAKLRIEQDARRKFSVEVEDVPAGAYEFYAEDVSQGTINVVNSASGTEGEIEFSSGEDNGDELPLTFDPSTATFTIQSGGVVYFQGKLADSIGGINNPPGGGTTTTPTSFREDLASTRLDPDASGHAKFEIDDRGRRKFSVEIEDVAVGSYELWVGGARRAIITASLKVTKVGGEIEFEDDDDRSHLPLNFDPRGQLIEVRTAAGVFFSHLFGFGSASDGNPGAGATNTTLSIPVRIEVPLFNLTASSGASAKAKFRRDDRGRRDFELEIEDAQVGSYTLMVGGVAVATINVVTTPGGTHGEIEFEDDDDNTHPLLTFDPLGQEISITRDGEVRFQRVFPMDN